MTVASEILKRNSSQIMENWESLVKKEIPASNISSDLALRNQLPNVLEDIADIIDLYDEFSELEKNKKYEAILKNSYDHGRHRATTSHYTLQQILKEYVIFHKVLTETLVKNKVYTKKVGNTLKYTLETAMLTSATSFSDSLQEMREKLIGTLAHDIRNPISAAYFALDVINSSDDKERIESLKTMGLRSLKKSLDLVEGLLDAISVKAGEGITLNFSEIDLVREIRWVYKEASEIYNNEINFECKEKEIIGIFDGTALRRVVENLVANAVKYGSRNSKIAMMIENAVDEVVIKVHNIGKPINKSSQSEIFEFLNRGSKSQNSELAGWGMGLTLVKSVALAHGGKVTLESNKEQGTTFSIILKKNFNQPGKVRTELNYSPN
ncbi:HAMP domain-containing histidine kinase [Gramella sp. MT6]|uniref:sensor histidine kinase n=1 Tax=Gramella sp. MT6 TaxID=2705471 RepID=UPI001C5EC60A|nr:HAMP domain-containing sensor histidine kinase [Gramella sp. MT6]QYA25933.1 HAMP domain-containing histidine kinase [Gramella sp. MT6]